VSNLPTATALGDALVSLMACPPTGIAAHSVLSKSTKGVLETWRWTACVGEFSAPGGKETEPGSLIWQVFSTTITNFLPTLYKPIDLSIDYSARTARLTVPGVVEGRAESIRNPVTGAAHQVRVTMPTGFEFTESEVVSGKSKATGPIELELDGSHAHLARIHWGTRGVVR